MSTLAGILANALRWYHECHQRDGTSERLRIAIEQFHRASGPEQADVIRALLGLTKAKDADGKWCSLHNVMRFLEELTPCITLRDCIDEATRIRVSNMLHGKRGRGWEDSANVDWSEVIRCIEGERNIVPTIFLEVAWKRWFVQEAKRHERYFGKDSPSDCWVEENGMLFSSAHARECRKIADEVATGRTSPSQFYEQRLARYQEQIDKYDTETDAAIPTEVDKKIRELEE